MIQRIQTIFMLLSILIIVPFLYMSFAQFSVDSGIVYQLKIWGLFSKSAESTHKVLSFIPLLVVFFICLIYPLINIFMYKKRKTQIRNNGFAILSNTLLIAGMFYFIENALSDFGKEGIKPDYSFIIFLPAISILCLFLANRFIKKDEALIRSVDRIR